MPESDPVGREIQELLRQPLSADVEEFARILLYTYRIEALAVAHSGLEREFCEALIAERRRKLRDQLHRLLGWARDSGKV